MTQPEFEPFKPEFQYPTDPLATSGPEALRRAKTPKGRYTIEGGAKLEAFDKALDLGNIEQIRWTIHNACCYMEGGGFVGLDANRYDINDDRIAIKLLNQFTTVEGSTSRRQYGELLKGIREGLTDVVEETWEYEENPDAWKEVERARIMAERRAVNMQRLSESEVLKRLNRESEAGPILTSWQLDEEVDKGLEEAVKRIERLREHRNTLLAFDEHVENRLLVFDPAFSQRQQASQEEDKQVQLTGTGVQPDKGHYVSLFGGDAVYVRNPAGEIVLDDEGKPKVEISEWGTALNDTMKAIIDVADARNDEFLTELQSSGLTREEAEKTSRELYARGFQTLGEFKAWFRAIKQHAKVGDTERMDVLWKAWKMCLWTEAITKRAWTVDDRTGGYVLGNPPLATDLMSKGIHNEKIRAAEYGWTAVYREYEERVEGRSVQVQEIVDLDDLEEIHAPGGTKGRGLPRLLKQNKKTGEILSSTYMTLGQFEEYIDNQDRSKVTPYKISHSGHPMSIGRIGRLVDEYLVQAKIKGEWQHPDHPNDSSYTFKDISLFEIWTGQYMADGRTFEAVNMADLKKFPWFETELKHAGSVGEMPSGSAGGWFLNRLRTSLVRGKQLREIPQPREMTVEYFEKNFRNWDKLGLIKPGEIFDATGRPANESEILTGGGVLFSTNPVANWIAGVLRARSESTHGMKDNVKAFKRVVSGVDDTRAYSAWTRHNRSTTHKMGASTGDISDSDIVQVAFDAKVISEAETNWLLNRVVRKAS